VQSLDNVIAEPIRLGIGRVHREIFHMTLDQVRDGMQSQKSSESEEVDCLATHRYL
jgi:hypothetical protein